MNADRIEDSWRQLKGKVWDQLARDGYLQQADRMPPLDEQERTQRCGTPLESMKEEEALRFG